MAFLEEAPGKQATTSLAEISRSTENGEADRLSSAGRSVAGAVSVACENDGEYTLEWCRRYRYGCYC